MPKEINSLNNEEIKRIVKLRDRRTRDQANLTVIDGIRELKAALKANVKMEAIYCCASILEKQLKDKAEQRLITGAKNAVLISPQVYEKIAYGERKDGVVAVGQPISYSLADLEIRDDTLLLIIEGIEKPGNIGAILRSAEGAGVKQVLAADCLTDLYNPNVIRASLGTIFLLKVISCTNDQAGALIKKNKFKVITASPKGETVYWNADLKGKTALVVGSEEKGLSNFWLTRADKSVKIPMKGEHDSLNVSTSTAILLYEAVRQRSQ